MTRLGGTVTAVKRRRTLREQENATRPVAVLGISAHYHDSAAALVVDGEIIAAVQEERFSRRKNDPSFPENAVLSVLELGGITPSDLTAAVFYESPFAKFERILSTQVASHTFGPTHFVRSLSATFPAKMQPAGELRRVLGEAVPLHYGDHHLSHAASAFYPSPYVEAAILTIDGVGEWTTASISRGGLGGVEFLEQVEYPNSLGMFFSALTAYCGFRVNSGEYKLMGLAPYGQYKESSRIASELLSEVIHLSEDGSFALNPRYFEFVTSKHAYGVRLEQLLGGPTREEGSPLTQHHANIAAATQMVLDRAVLGLACRAHALTGLTDLCMAGGVALNVTSNSFVAKRSPFSSLWVQPAAGDAGGALGAALWATHDVHGVPRSRRKGDRMRGALLGPVPGGDIERQVRDRGLVGVRLEPDMAAERLAAVLAAGGIVGVAVGRMEFGPRALGARSILADPRVPGMQRRLNEATKLREGFRPFAPAVTQEDVSVWFTTHESSPFMLRTFPVRNAVPPSTVPDPATSSGEGWSAMLASVGGPLPAVTHVDLSARVQTVDLADNPCFHRILSAFKALTGCPVLVNTSFNVRGEPIVCSSDHALDAFLRMGLDALLLEDVLLLRVEQSSAALAQDLPSIEGSD